MQWSWRVSWLSGLVASGSAQDREPHKHHPSAKSGELGEIAFANSGAAAAQASFLRGLALLHSFEYDEAADAFRDAQRADPSFAMAFWGEAVTYSHLLWGEDDPDARTTCAGAAGANRGSAAVRAGTPSERAYGEAIEALYVDGDLPSRVRGFAAGMRKVAQAYPDDLDAAAFTSLALMFAEYVGELPADRATAFRDEAITVGRRRVPAQPAASGGRALRHSRHRRPGVRGARARRGAPICAHRA